MCGGCCVEYIIAISLCVWGGKLYSTSAISMRVCGGCCVEYISYKPVYVCVWGGGELYSTLAISMCVWGGMLRAYSTYARSGCHTGGERGDIPHLFWYWL